MKATGLPSHIGQNVSIKETKKEVSFLRDEVKDLKDMLITQQQMLVNQTEMLLKVVNGIAKGKQLIHFDMSLLLYIFNYSIIYFTIVLCIVML